jgi:hypothetical protein
MFAYRKILHYDAAMKTILLTAALLIASTATATPKRGFVGHSGGLQDQPKPVVHVVHVDVVTREQAMGMVKQDAKLLDAIQKVETGGEEDPAHAKGDHGLAHGWYQLHESYFKDAETQMKEKFFDYLTACADKVDSQIVVSLYWRKWGAHTMQEKALCHHYGYTKWHADKTADADGYWAKVQAAMKTAK